MNKFFLFGCLLSSIFFVNTNASEPRVPLSEVSEVITADGQSKDQIFEASKVWIAKSFKSANNVIQYADKESGSIIGKGNIPYPCDGFIDCNAFGKDVVNFTIKIDTKDNKARVIFTDINRLALTPLRGAVSTTLGREFPIAQEKQKQNVKSKLDFVIKQYSADINNAKSNNDW